MIFVSYLIVWYFKILSIKVKKMVYYVNMYKFEVFILTDLVALAISASNCSFHKNNQYNNKSHYQGFHLFQE